MEKYIMNENRGRSISGAIVFFLLGIFALFAVIMVLLSAHAYTSAVDHSAQNAQNRILHHYIVNTLRANDCENAVSVRPMGDGNRLVIALSEEMGVEMSIYAMNGYLMEMYSYPEDFNPEYGEPIMKLSSFDVSIDENLLSANCVDENGNSHTISVFLYSASGGGAE